MSLPFFFALSTAIIAFVLYANLSGEVSRLCAIGIVVLCFMLDLILAPWPIQALILLFVLTTSKNIVPSNARF